MSDYYAELRKEKIEENKRKLEQLKRLQLSNPSAVAAAPHQLTSAPNTSLPAKGKGKASMEEEHPAAARCSRSDHDAGLRVQEASPEVVQQLRRISKQRKDLSDRVYASDGARTYARTKAVELGSKLGAKFPSFVKPMLQSHTTGGFWLGLPTKFCNQHLPKQDFKIILIDEDRKETETTYLAQKKGLSAGWRGFSIAHKLVDGDALVFQLVQPTRFKVMVTAVDQSFSAKHIDFARVLVFLLPLCPANVAKLVCIENSINHIVLVLGQ